MPSFHVAVANVQDHSYQVTATSAQTSLAREPASLHAQLAQGRVMSAHPKDGSTLHLPMGNSL